MPSLGTLVLLSESLAVPSRADTAPAPSPRAVGAPWARLPLELNRNLTRRRFRAQPALDTPTPRNRMTPKMEKQQCRESPGTDRPEVAPCQGAAPLLPLLGDTAITEGHCHQHGTLPLQRALLSLRDTAEGTAMAA